MVRDDPKSALVLTVAQVNGKWRTSSQFTQVVPSRFGYIEIRGDTAEAMEF